jgi:hypothetical protein
LAPEQPADLRRKPVLSAERESASQVLKPHLNQGRRFIKNNQGGIPMRCKLAISALVIATSFGATAIASAQTQPAPGASSQGNVKPDATKSNMKPGVTTGSATTKTPTIKGVARNPSTDNDAGIGRGK